MPTYKEQQILDKVCKVTRQKQIKCYDFIPFFDFQYEKIIFNCQPSHFSPCSAVPGVRGIQRYGVCEGHTPKGSGLPSKKLEHYGIVHDCFEMVYY